jgi:hypothetical protein
MLVNGKNHQMHSVKKEEENHKIFAIKLFTVTYAEQSPNCDGLLFVIVKTKFDAYVLL